MVGRLCFQYYLFKTKNNAQNLVNFVNVRIETSANFAIAGVWIREVRLQFMVNFDVGHLPIFHCVRLFLPGTRVRQLIDFSKDH